MMPGRSGYSPFQEQQVVSTHPSCLGCCWLLFVILFPLGMMNVAASAVITLLIFAEKALPLGQWASRIAAAALIVYGAVVIIWPHTLPTVM